MWRIAITAIVLLLIISCGETSQPQPTPNQAATQTAVFERINKDLTGATPTP